MMEGHARCPRCGRILALTDGKIPRHRVPPPRKSSDGSVPLTGTDAKWCQGL